MKINLEILSTHNLFLGKKVPAPVSVRLIPSPRRRAGWRALVLFACCVAILGSNRGVNQSMANNPKATPTPIPARGLGNQLNGRDLREDPPVVESITARPLPNPTAEGNALLVVQFARDEKLPPQLTINTENGQLTLHDDGKNGDETANDSRFSAIAKLDVEALRKNNENRLSRAKNATIPIFVKRTLVRKESASRLLERVRQGTLIDLSPFGISSGVDINRSLMIRDPAVVGDPTRTRTTCSGGGSSSMGKWSFGYLMQQMANQGNTGISASDFTLQWLQTWLSPQNINGWTVAQRSLIQSKVITPWLQASGGTTLDLSKAPFKLLAIVNRIDLRQNLTYGGGSAGEGRFVFGVMDSSCNPLQFTVIFEYGITKGGCNDVKNWGKQWKDLDMNSIGSPAYNAALEAITEQFVKANANMQKPNRSALNQLRTNEFALGPLPWELREFQIDSSSHLLKTVTVKQTPDLSLNQTATLVNYINSSGPNQVVPLLFQGSPFRGGFAPTPSGIFWNNPATPIIMPRTKRFDFSLSTCTACHDRETNTGFTHVKPASFGGTASLSGFLTGITVVDPADGTPTRQFDDLTRRAADLDALLNSCCFCIIKMDTLRMVD